MEQVRRKSKKKEERKEREREREREPFGRRGEAVETPPTRFLCGPQLCCFFGPRNETLPANNPTRVLIFADDPALTGEETSWPSPSPRKKLNTTSAAKDFRLLQILSFVTTNVSYPFYRLLDTCTTMKISLGEIAPRDSTRAILPSFEFRGEARRA